MKLYKGKCLITGCDVIDKIYSRGLCIGHYTMIRRLVQEKKRTWEEFEKVGMVLVSKKGRQSVKRKLLDEMLKKKGLNPPQHH